MCHHVPGFKNVGGSQRFRVVPASDGKVHGPVAICRWVCEPSLDRIEAVMLRRVGEECRGSRATSVYPNSFKS